MIMLSSCLASSAMSCIAAVGPTDQPRDEPPPAGLCTDIKYAWKPNPITHFLGYHCGSRDGRIVDILVKKKKKSLVMYKLAFIIFESR